MNRERRWLCITAYCKNVKKGIRGVGCFIHYFELSDEFNGSSANWCTFATWASKQAGQTIRQEDLLRAFEDRFAQSSEVSAALEAIFSHLTPIGASLRAKVPRAAILQGLDPAAAFARASDAVARGNKKVFEEIAREFARFLAGVDSDIPFNRDKIAAFCATLRPGDPPHGQLFLVEAFTAYGAARFQTGKAKEDSILLANLCAGYHEQTRLQPEITEALNAALGNAEDFKRNLLASLAPGFSRRFPWSGLVDQATDLDRVLAGLIDAVNRLIREVVTDHLMTLHLPGGEVLRLGRDLTNKFPEDLAQIFNPRLLEILARVDLTPDSLRESGTEDWANFPDRMHFIADFFRVYQMRQQLFEPPFTDRQAALIKSGVRPDGPL